MRRDLYTHTLTAATVEGGKTTVSTTTASTKRAGQAVEASCCATDGASRKAVGLEHAEITCTRVAAIFWVFLWRPLVAELAGLERHE